ncbi:MAG: recombinase RecA [Myxococcales bacterium]|nr:recombinase RecA [Myxococcales bacterium]
MGKSIDQGALSGLVKKLEKAFGRGILMPLDGESTWDEGVIPTGSFALDRGLGIGGIPRGRIVEVYGPEASGKTTLALSCIAEAQKEGSVCAFIDAEHALNMTYVRDIGIDPSQLLVSQPDCGEQALEVVEQLVRSESVDLIVVDSVAALTPKAEIEGEMGDHNVGLHARLMSRAMRKLAGLAHKNGTTLLFINQIRHKIGVMFGSPETTTGGNALKFYASCRLDVRRIGSLKKGDEIYGNRIRIKVVKNKMAPPFRKVETELHFGRGFCRAGELLDVAHELGAVTRSGAYYRLGEELLGQGKAAAVKKMEADAALLERVELAIEACELASADA